MTPARWLVSVGVAGALALASGGTPVRADDRIDERVAIAGYADAPDEAPAAPHPVDGYRRGRRITIQVVMIDWAEVEVTTARALVAMRDAAAADGVSIRVRSGYRDNDLQALLYGAWRAGWGNPAARPGFSVHQSGQALDLELDDGTTFPWLEANAARFGFRRTVRKEPWHWEYNRRYIKKPRGTRRR